MAELAGWLQAPHIPWQNVHGEARRRATGATRKLGDLELEVVLEEVEGNPGYYTSKFFLRPHYQLEGLTVSLRLVSKLPSTSEMKRCDSSWMP